MNVYVEKYHRGKRELDELDFECWLHGELNSSQNGYLESKVSILQSVLGGLIVGLVEKGVVTVSEVLRWVGASGMVFGSVEEARSGCYSCQGEGSGCPVCGGS